MRETDKMTVISVYDLPYAPASNRLIMPHVPVVYFAYTPEHGILYVGSCVSLRNRWAVHHLRYIFKEIPNLCVSWIFQSDDKERVMAEQSLINRLQPPLNYIHSNTRGGIWYKNQEIARRRKVFERLCGRALLPV